MSNASRHFASKMKSWLKKDDCCIHCRKPFYCKINENFKIKENDFWMPNSVDFNQKKSSNPCKVCQCVEGELVCYTKSCENAKYPSFAHLNAYYNENKEINARTIPFLADFIKGMSKDTMIYVSSGPKYSSLYIDDKPVNYFKLGDIGSSKVYYKLDSIDDFSTLNTDDKHKSSGEQEDLNLLKQTNDFAVLSLISPDNKTIHNILIQFEIFKSTDDQDELNELLKPRKEDSLLSRSIKNLNQNTDRNPRGFEKSNTQSKDHLKLSQTPRKTIFIQPGESIKLTSNELKPKTLPPNTNPDKLIYFLVSANPKYGELKLKKVFTSDESVPAGWNKVNDLYLEKPVKDFTQNDLDNGNVWYEPYNDFSSLNNVNLNSGCRNKTGGKPKPKKRLCPYGEDCDEYPNEESEEDEENTNCNEEPYSNLPSLSFNIDSSQAKYDHCLFEVKKIFFFFLKLKPKYLKIFFFFKTGLRPEQTKRFDFKRDNTL